MAQLIVFTDLDGTLLDANTYEPQGSYEALRRLIDAEIPVVFCSAKTRAEQDPLRQRLDVRHPYVVENGSAVFIPPDTIPLPLGDPEPDGMQRILLGLPIEELHQRLDVVREKTGLEFEGFSQMSAERVAELTGLSLEGARLATRRDYSDTIVPHFSDDERQRFMTACEELDLRCPSGGRFLTVTGRGADKGKAVTLLRQQYSTAYGSITSAAVGDSPNDAPMLAAVERPYLVQRPDESWHDVDVPRLRYLPAVGPRGFALMVEDLLD